MKILKTLHDWFAIVHQVSERYKTGELKYVEGSLISELDHSLRCENGAILCTLGATPEDLMGKRRTTGWGLYYENKIQTDLEDIHGCKQAVHCGICNAFETNMCGYIAHLNDMHQLFGETLELQMHKDFESVEQ